MSERRLRQYYGPSERHERACVELRFPLDGGTYRLAAVEPALAQLGFKLGEFLPDEPFAGEEAVCRLARTMLAPAALALPAPWWNSHGRDSDGAWAAIGHPYPEAAAAALEGALDLIQAQGTLSAPATAKLRRLSQWLAQTMKSALLMQAAADVYGLEVAHVNALSPVYQIGQGAQGLYFEQAASERDALLGGIIAKNKQATALTLRRFGLPAPHGELVQTEQQAIAALARVGFPCVVKPVSMNKGTGVATGLRSEAQVLAAVAHARTLSPQPVLIENHVEGADHRLMVAGDALLWAYRKDPSVLIGDGVASVRQLIERENRSRAKIRSGTDAYLYPIATDAEFERFLSDRYGLTPDTVLAAGRSIEAAPQANIARGGRLSDVTGSVHPDNRALAIQVGRLLRTWTTGIDFLTTDIARSWKDGGCAIIEVNSGPGISGMGDASLLLRASFPNRLSGRIPTVIAIGDEAFQAQAAEAVRAAFAQHARHLSTTTYPGGPRGAGRQSPLAATVETLLLDPYAEAALIACGADDVVRLGLPLRGCDVLIVQDTQPADWLSRGAETVLPGRLSSAKLKRAVGDLVRRYDDPAQGGARPVLEPVGAKDAATFTLKVWRARPAPRAWFWDQVGLKAPHTDGLTTQDDLLAAVRALASNALAKTAKLPAAFAHDELIGSWFRMTFEASLALPAANRTAARAALLAATERVNAIVHTTIADSGGLC
jgi:D-alanine-D-alanine ligase-like ATP-grasp enzyme